MAGTSPAMTKNSLEETVAEDFLKNPLSLFDVKGKTAIVTGASGAFGALAAQTLAGAGANVVLAASKQDELKKVAAACDKLGGKAEIVALRPNLSTASTSWWSPQASTKWPKSSI